MTDDKSREAFEKSYASLKVVSETMPTTFYEFCWKLWTDAASLTLTVLLPKKIGLFNYLNDPEWAGWNACVDEIRALNADKSIVWEERKT